MSANTPPRPTEREDSRSLFSLLRELPATLLELVRIEFEELKREMGRKLKKLGLGVLLLSMAATLGLFLLGTLILAALVVAGALLLLMIILLAAGVNTLKKGSPPLPTETFDALIEDAHALKGEGRFDQNAR